MCRRVSAPIHPRQLTRKYCNLKTNCPIKSNAFEAGLGNMHIVNQNLREAMKNNKPDVVHKEYVKILNVLANKYVVNKGQVIFYLGESYDQNKFEDHQLQHPSKIFVERLSDALNCWILAINTSAEKRRLDACPQLFFAYDEEEDMPSLEFEDIGRRNAPIVYKFEFINIREKQRQFINPF